MTNPNTAYVIERGQGVVAEPGQSMMMLLSFSSWWIIFWSIVLHLAEGSRTPISLLLLTLSSQLSVTVAPVLYGQCLAEGSLQEPIYNIYTELN